mgnify:CR=1 FL=1|tara:strand:+ start:15806 stop:16501 length:696 start_codon:yes stop_codon:yes gene_type:complete
MKTVSKILVVFLILASFASCSTVKVSDAWKDSRIEDIKSGKVLIAFKSNDDVARQRFEKDMAAEIIKRGPQFEVVPSYVNFPDVDPDEKHTPEQIHAVRTKLKEMGVTIAIITKVKSINESVVTSVNTDPGYGTYGYGGFGGYGGYGGYYSGMYRTGYYHNMNMGYVGGGSSTAITETEKEFVVETLLYDLTLPESEQLLSVVTSLVDDPKSLVTTSNDFAKAVIKQLFKK